MKYPIKPPWAASVWSDEDWIYAELVAATGAKHNIRVPHTVEGMHKIIHMVKVLDTSSRLGMAGAPTQHQIDKPDYDPRMVRRVTRKGSVLFTEGQRQTAREILRKMGLT